MSSYGYTPPYGFGNDVPAKKKNPYEDQLPSGGAGAAAGSVASAPLPGLGYVGTYSAQTTPTGMDFSTPVQLQVGSRDAPLEMDAPYQQLMSALGLDADNARINMVNQQARLDAGLTTAQRDLAQQSQEDRYGIDAALRARGTGMSGQRQQLQARALANMEKGMGNLATQTADQKTQAERDFLDYKGGLERQGLQGLSEASSRLQSQKDAAQARIDQQRWQEQQMAASASQNAALINAMNTQSTNPAAMQAPSQPDAGFSQPAAAAPPPAMAAAPPAAISSGGGSRSSGPAGGQSFADWYAGLSPADRAAWDAFSRGSQQPVTQSTNAAEYRSGVQPTKPAPAPLRPMIGKY